MFQALLLQEIFLQSMFQDFLQQRENNDHKTQPSTKNLLLSYCAILRKCNDGIVILQLGFVT